MMRVPTDDKGNQRDRIIRVLLDASNDKGYVRDMDIHGISRLTGVNGHDVAKHLWGLQKQGLVGFSTKHEGGKTVPYRFRLTAKMRDSLSEPTERPSEALEPEEGTEIPVAKMEAVVPVSEEQTVDAAGLLESRRPAFDAEHFPEIHRLIEQERRREQVEEAARTLEAAGLDDLALQALEAVKPLSALEAEILAVVRAFRTPDWGKPGPTFREMVEAISAD